MTDLGDIAARYFKIANTAPDVLFDIDGVLGFLMESALSALNARFETTYTVAGLKDYWLEGWLPKDQGDWLSEQFEGSRLYLNVAPDYTAIAAARALREMGCKLIVASDRPESARKVTQDWLDRWRVPYDTFDCGRGAKLAEVDAHGTRPLHMFDDDPRKAQTVPKDGVNLWLPRRPWTGTVSGFNVTVFDFWDHPLTTLGVPMPIAIGVPFGNGN